MPEQHENQLAGTWNWHETGDPLQWAVITCIFFFFVPKFRTLLYSWVQRQDLAELAVCQHCSQSALSEFEIWKTNNTKQRCYVCADSKVRDVNEEEFSKQSLLPAALPCDHNNADKRIKATINLLATILSNFQVSTSWLSHRTDMTSRVSNPEPNKTLNPNSKPKFSP